MRNQPNQPQDIAKEESVDTDINREPDHFVIYAIVIAVAAFAFCVLMTGRHVVA
ncbi:MAG: hypothetical protein JNN20_14045 [Betaproteobacteria bacterium]|nr:hypothetical protein [Betaproteobacteria bacterium]